MAPIRWDNINAPSFRDSMLALNAAGNNFDAVAANIHKLAAEQNKIGIANWDNQSRLNTESAVSALQKAASLGDLHGMEDQYNSGALHDQFGAQVDPTKVAEALKMRLGVLQDRSFSDALTSGNAVADSTHSAAQAGEAARQSVLAKGGTEKEANDAALNVTKSLEVKQAAWNEDNKNKSLDWLTQNVFNQNLVGKDPSMILAAAREQFGPNFDLSTIQKGIDDTLGRQVTAQQQRDAAASRQREATRFGWDTQRQAEWVRDVNDQKNSQTVLNTALATLSKDGSIRDAADIIDNADLKPGSKAALVKQLRDHVVETAKLDPVQQLEYNNHATLYNQDLERFKTVTQRELDQIGQKIKTASPFKPDIIQQATTLGSGDPAGLIGAMAKTADANGWNWIVGNDVQFNNDMRDAIVETRETLDALNLSPEEQNAVMLQGFQNMGGNRNARLGKTGIDTTEFKKAAFNVAKELADQKVVEATYAPRVQEVQQAQKDAEHATVNRLNEIQENFSRNNLKHIPTSLGKYSPVLTGDAKTVKATVDARIAAGNAKLLEDAKKRQEAAAAVLGNAAEATKKAKERISAAAGAYNWDLRVPTN